MTQCPLRGLRPRPLLGLAIVSLLTAAIPVHAEVKLNLTVLGAKITQTGGSNVANPPALALDNNIGTFSETPDATNSFWEVELPREVRINRIEFDAPTDAPNNLVLRIQDLRDRTVYQTNITGFSGGTTWFNTLPAPVDGRIIRFALEDGQTNGVGTRVVTLAEVRAYGDPSPAFGPVSITNTAVATQTSTTLDAGRAIDGNPSTYSETLDQTNAFWLLTFENSRPIQRVEIVNRSDSANAARLGGLTLRILDNDSNTVASTTVVNPGASNNFVYTPPANTSGRYIKIGLENDGTNGQGNHIVSLAEVSVVNSTNYAQGQVSYMTRSHDGLLPVANVNDGSYATPCLVHQNTVDGYFEVDLGQTIALYSVRTVAADGQQARTTHTTLRIYDAFHNSVYSEHFPSNTTVETFDLPLPAPVLARYIRVGLENKERTTPPGTGWWFGLKELQAYGRSSNEVGVLSLTATATNISSGGSTTLNWQESDLNRLDLYPNAISVGSNTLASGLGSRSVTLTNSTKFLLVGVTHTNVFTRALTITVNGQSLPAQISEFVANNRFSLKDGNNSSPDWVELHNPNNTALDLTGYGLSDDPALPMKFTIPSGVTIPPHGYLIVFASDSDTPFDTNGFLHANFTLDANPGESIVLTASNGVTMVDWQTNYPPQREDLAYGRTLTGEWAFLEPTPGAPNVANSYDGWLAEIDFSHKRGWYTNSFSLVISNANPASDVYWSTNGYEPTNLYTGPLAINNITGVRATVKRAGYKSPRTKTHTYLFLDGILAQSTMSTTYTLDPAYTNRLRQGFYDLPIFSVNVPPAPNIVNAERDEREASMEIFMPDGNDIQENCGITHYGGAFGTGTGNPYGKKSYQLKFRAEYGAAKLQFPLFGGFDHGFLSEESFDEIDLHGGNHDMSSRGFYLSHRFAADTMLDMGSLNPHGRFAHLIVNGVYWGMYDAHERLTDSFLSEYLGGAKEDYLTVKGNDNGPSNNFILGVPEPPDRAAWEFVYSNRSSYAAVKGLLDVTNLIDFMLVWNWGNSEAEFRAAGGRTAGGGRGFKFWIADADGHLRNPSGVAAVLTRNATAITGPGTLFAPLLAEGHPDFKALLADRIYYGFFNDGPMTAAANEARMNLRMNEITNSMVAECARWGSLVGQTPNDWLADAQYARDNLFPFRNQNLLGYMRTAGWYPNTDVPTFSQFGGSVSNGYTLTISNTTGTIYYTLDGTDPRLPGGGISPSAIAWSGGTSYSPISLLTNSSWRWRKGTNEVSSPLAAWRTNTFDDSAWSTGTSPFQYGIGANGTVLSDMRSNYTTVFIRKTFVVPSPVNITNLRLTVAVDDGFVAWINGVEFARTNVVNTFATNIATANHTSSPARDFTNFNVLNFLVPGTNVLCVQGFNRDLRTSTDFYIDAALSGNVTNTTGQPLTLTITSNTVVNLRVWTGSEWSALATASYVIGEVKQPVPGDLLISEIHYNPQGPDDYEFIEIYNLSSNILDLTNVRFEDGVDYLFPNKFLLAPGAFALVVENTAAFDQLYRTNSSLYFYPNLLVAGAWSGALNNAGERLAMVASNNTVLAEVSYEPGGPWPSRADSRGSSLELRNPAANVSTNPATLKANLNRGANWRSSVLYNGSPGRLDTQPREMVINEVLSHTDVGVDWIELQNTTGSTLTLSNYYLSDHYDLPLKYAISNGTSVAAGAFLVRNATQLGFGFSELGSDLLLVQVTGTNIIRFVDTADIPAAQREETFGRYTRSDAIVDFTELRSKTQAATNSLPRVGPVVFSEIMYNPTNGNAEYVELVNIAKTNVLLYDPAFPTNHWELSDAVDFVFPAGQQLTPGQVVLICATNPTDFRAQYGIDPGITVYGPWTGALNNAGEAVRLRQPGTPETNGFVPYYRVDRVRYEPIAPWPTDADLGGVSLERIPLEGYGNDPVNWQASVSGGTPGTYVGNRLPDLTVDGNTTVAEGDTINLTAEAVDVDQPWQTLALSAQDLPPGATFNTNSGAFSWTTSEIYGPAVYNVKFLATDNGVIPLVRTQTVALTVLESNRPPTISPIANLQYPALLPFTLNVSASDPDLPAQTLAFSALGLPPGLTIHPTSGQISGAASIQGVFPVTVSVSDDQTPALSATNGFTLTIAPPFSLQSSLSGPGQPNFSFWAMAGETYQILYTTNLTSPSWQVLTNIPSAPGGLYNVPPIPSANAPASFIRVLWIRD